MEPSTAGGNQVWVQYLICGGSKYSAIYGLGGLISRVEHPWGDKNTLMLLLIARTKFSDFSDQRHYR